jgi:hypothetical protein
MLTAFQLRWHRDCIPACDPSGDSFGQTIGSLLACVVEIDSSSERFRQIGKPDVEAFAILLG